MSTPRSYLVEIVSTGPDGVDEIKVSYAGQDSRQLIGYLLPEGSYKITTDNPGLRPMLYGTKDNGRALDFSGLLLWWVGGDDGWKAGDRVTIPVAEVPCVAYEAVEPV